jgi:hypothetical protein
MIPMERHPFISRFLRDIKDIVSTGNSSNKNSNFTGHISNLGLPF